MTALALIRQLNETDEHSRCEAKTAQQLGRSLLETVCAFSNEPNLGGGFLLLGVKREDWSLLPSYEFAGLKSVDKLQADIATQCRTAFNRPVRPQIKVEIVHGNAALVVFVPEAPVADKPIYFANEQLPRGAYRRTGSTDHRCSEDDLLIFYGNQQRETYDRSVLSDCTMEDIDQDAVLLYRSMRREIRPDAEELLWSDEELLCALSDGCH